MSPENSRSNVGKKGSSRGLEVKLASFARDGLALATKRSIGLCEIEDSSGSRAMVVSALGAMSVMSVMRELGRNEEVRLM